MGQDDGRHGQRRPLPIPATPLVARETELAAIGERLGAPEVRLLTLTGAGGTGKTRLALQVAGDLQGDFADGACFVPLGPVAGSDLVASAVAQALGTSLAGATALSDR